MIYIDTSSLLKLLMPEPETEAVQEAVDAERDVVLTPLTELEVVVQLHAMLLGGDLSPRQHHGLNAKLQSLRGEVPFQFQQVPSASFSTALRQHHAAGTVHCRAVDRLHLAAMEELSLKRLVTNDAAQATAAIALGFEVVVPK